MFIFAPFGWLYGRAIDLRNRLYDRGILRSYDLGARTISVGNITTGGTGKTPLVARVAEVLAENGDKVCILTRGYGRKNSAVRVLVSNGERVLVDAETGGDEPVELAKKLLGKAIVIADADRVRSAKWAKENFEVTAFILDDGFQHRRAKRDVDIVCIDATDPWGNGKILPSGTLRESLNGLKRADAFVITRSDLIDDGGELIDRLSLLDQMALIFRARNHSNASTLERFREASNEIPPALPKARSFAFCALGNPDAFFEVLRREGVDVAGTHEFRDHHRYTQSEIEQIEARAKGSKAEVLLTTAKDAVKLDGIGFTFPCYVVEIDTVVEDADEFRNLILTS